MSITKNVIFSLIISSAASVLVTNTTYADSKVSTLKPVASVEVLQLEKPFEIKQPEIVEVANEVEKKSIQVEKTKEKVQETKKESAKIEEVKLNLSSEIEKLKAEIEATKAKIEEKKRLEAEAAAAAEAERIAAQTRAQAQVQVQAPSYQAQSLRPIGSSAGNTYAPGYCTWYVKNMKPNLPNNLGNANEWYYRAQAQGMAVGSAPAVGAAAMSRSEMHVAYVEAVNGNMITISEMNYGGLYRMNTRTVPASQFLYIY